MQRQLLIISHPPAGATRQISEVWRGQQLLRA